MLITNKVKLLSLSNSRKGEVGYILANGPSLAQENLDILRKRENIITLNASPLLEEEHGFHSDYYCLTDPRFLEIEEKKDIALKKLRDDNCISLCRDIMSEHLDFEGVNPIYVNSLGRDGFSKNLIKGFYFGATTTMLAVQLAYWIGLREVYILGLDLNYLSKSYGRFYREDRTQVTDLLVSVQIRNLAFAAKCFENEERKLYITNKNSWASCYLECKKL